MMLQALDRIFDDDDRRIDDQADGDGEAAETHQVCGHAERRHHHECHERRKRQCYGDHDGRAQVSEKREQQNNDEDCRFQKRLCDGSHGFVDQIRNDRRRSATSRHPATPASCRRAARGRP